MLLSRLVDNVEITSLSSVEETALATAKGGEEIGVAQNPGC
jgi:hypothetical protein